MDSILPLLLIRQVFKALVLLAASVFLLSASATDAEEVWPEREWQIADSASVGLSESKADAYVSWLTSKAQSEPFGTVVVRHGRIAIEHYGSGASRQSAWEIGSIRKAVGSALLGMAVEEKKLAPDNLARDVWPEIYEQTGKEKDKQIRVKHLFNSTSGWKRSERPGAKWVYNNAAFTAGGMLLGRVYQQPEDRIAALAKSRIAERIGATSWRCYHYQGGFSAGAGNPGPKLAIDSNLRDLARFGYLWLRQGRWKDSQVVPAAYVRQATRNQVGDLGGHYGYCWFTNDDRKLLPNAPADAYFHVGNGKEGRRTVLAVIPSLELVAGVGTHASTYDITRGYKAQPIPPVNEWIGKLLEAFEK